MHSILFVAAIMAIISFCSSFAAERDNGTIKEASKSKVRGGVAFGKFGGGGPDWPLPPLTAPPTTQDWRDVAVFDSDDNSNPFSKKAGPAFAKRFMMFATSKSGSGDAQHFTPQQADLWCKTNACTFDAFASEACTTDTWYAKRATCLLSPSVHVPTETSLFFSHFSLPASSSHSHRSPTTRRHLGAIYSETEQKQVAAKLTDGRHLVTGGRVDLSARNSISWTDQIIPQQGEYYPYTNWVRNTKQQSRPAVPRRSNQAIGATCLALTA